MNNEARKSEMQKALTDWRTKYRVGNNDPLMATVEMWEILMQDTRAIEPHLLFRKELEKLTEITKTLSKQGGELTVELRNVPKIKNELWLFPYFTVVLIAVGGLVVGIFIGKFLIAG
ncbi:MAG: hypothetical protein ACREDS_09540 [Limisphaerales bacterium]